MTAPGRSSSVCLNTMTERKKSVLFTSKTPHDPVPTCLVLRLEGVNSYMFKKQNKFGGTNTSCTLDQGMFHTNFMYNTNAFCQRTVD